MRALATITLIAGTLALSAPFQKAEAQGYRVRGEAAPLTFLRNFAECKVSDLNLRPQVVRLVTMPATDPRLAMLAKQISRGPTCDHLIDGEASFSAVAFRYALLDALVKSGLMSEQPANSARTRIWAGCVLEADGMAAYALTASQADSDEEALAVSRLRPSLYICATPDAVIDKSASELRALIVTEMNLDASDDLAIGPQ